MSVSSLLRSREVNKGFTLIELLIVIAILGILTTAVLVAINPLEQFARGRDSGRKNMVDQLGHAIQAYYTAQNATYPATANWLTTLQTTQDIKTIPDNAVASGNLLVPSCAGGMQNNICYNANANDAVAYAVQGSRSEQVKAGGGVQCASTTFVVWSSAAGRTGLYCSATEPAPGITSLVY
jgi:prepilin-type N-terminal cleavage/methylation domain-containing protein